MGYEAGLPRVDGAIEGLSEHDCLSRGSRQQRTPQSVLLRKQSSARRNSSGSRVCESGRGSVGTRGEPCEALEAKRDGKARVILFNLCGHGHFDMQAYIDYREGKLTDQSYSEEELALAGLPSVA